MERHGLHSWQRRAGLLAAGLILVSALAGCSRGGGTAAPGTPGSETRSTRYGGGKDPTSKDRTQMMREDMEQAHRRQGQTGGR